MKAAGFGVVRLQQGRSCAAGVDFSSPIAQSPARRENFFGLDWAWPGARIFDKDVRGHAVKAIGLAPIRTLRGRTIIS
jgi:hypothetical protein